MLNMRYANMRYTTHNTQLLLKTQDFQEFCPGTPGSSQNPLFWSSSSPHVLEKVVGSSIPQSRIILYFEIEICGQSRQIGWFRGRCHTCHTFLLTPKTSISIDPAKQIVQNLTSIVLRCLHVRWKLQRHLKLRRVVVRRRFGAIKLASSTTRRK